MYEAKVHIDTDMSTPVMLASYGKSLYLAWINKMGRGPQPPEVDYHNKTYGHVYWHGKRIIIGGK
jgi:hypothetical protein